MLKSLLYILLNSIQFLICFGIIPTFDFANAAFQLASRNSSASIGFQCLRFHIWFFRSCISRGECKISSRILSRSPHSCSGHHFCVVPKIVPGNHPFCENGRSGAGKFRTFPHFLTLGFNHPSSLVIGKIDCVYCCRTNVKFFTTGSLNFLFT